MYPAYFSSNQSRRINIENATGENSEENFVVQLKLKGGYRHYIKVPVPAFSDAYCIQVPAFTIFVMSIQRLEVEHK